MSNTLVEVRVLSRAPEVPIPERGSALFASKGCPPILHAKDDVKDFARKGRDPIHFRALLPLHVDKEV